MLVARCVVWYGVKLLGSYIGWEALNSRYSSVTTPFGPFELLMAVFGPFNLLATLVMF